MSENYLASNEFVAREPTTGVPFLEAFRVQHGPPGLLGRFFLSADNRMKERGITLQFITFEELVELSELNGENWGSFNPMFDPRFSSIPPGALCLAGYDTKGVIRLCLCAKPFDARQRSFAALVNAGEFTSTRADRGKAHISATIDTDVAHEMRGVIGYAGALWVHPDARGGRFASIMGYIVNSCLLTLWNPAYLLGSVQKSTVGTGLFARYGYNHATSSLAIHSYGKQVAELTIMYMTAEEFTDGLAVYLDEIWPKIDAAVAARDRQ